MANKNTKTGGTDNTDGVVLTAADQNDTFDATLLQHIASDQTIGSIASSTTETEIGEVEVPADKISTGVLVVATGKGNWATGGGTIKLYGGTSATATSNTEFKSISRQSSATGYVIGWTIVFWVTGLTWSSLNYINITGTNSANHANNATFCESIVVFGK